MDSWDSVDNDVRLDVSCGDVQEPMDVGYSVVVGHADLNDIRVHVMLDLTLN